MSKLTDKTHDKRVHLHYLDGLRGLAALYVVFSHLWELQGHDLPGMWLSFSKIFRYGLFSVAIFIVLSGYCLMLPVARSQTGYISGGLLNYIKRRARRILPPYYSALILSLIVGILLTILINLHFMYWNNNIWGHFEHNFSLFDVVCHLFLIHNLIPNDEIYKINGPMWSVATEWQIYFLFPLILLPIWRRFGWFVVISLAFLLGLLPYYLSHGLIGRAHTWYLGLFALGMMAADIGFSQKHYLQKIRNSLPWGLLAAMFFGIALLADMLQKFGLEIWVNELCVGLAAACLLVYCTNCIVEEKTPPLVLKILQSPGAIALGTFSYSLYLMHSIVLTVLNQYLHTLQFTPLQREIIFYTTGLSLSLLIAYIFYLIFERPFMSGFLQKRKVKDAVKIDVN
jgi:peptidoglycan/LPS O-acetylase OafA/YrhL